MIFADDEAQGPASSLIGGCCGCPWLVVTIGGLVYTIMYNNEFIILQQAINNEYVELPNCFDE